MQSMNDAISNNNYIPLADLPAEDYDEEYLAMASGIVFWSLGS